jgi:putative transposase
MPKNLKRITGRGDLHFITFCCYQRRPLLASPRARNLVVQILKEVRARYHFALVGYVVMPEHIHLLMSESPCAAPSTILQVFKQRLSRRLRRKRRAPAGQLTLQFPMQQAMPRRFWQRRYYGFNVYSAAKVIEKLHYMHANPVKERFVKHPGDWPWSSWCSCYRGEGLLEIDPWTQPARASELNPSEERPTLCKNRKE